MNPVIYQKVGALVDGEYLPGQYRWGEKVRLLGAELMCRAPSGGAAFLQLELEVNGVLTGELFEIGGWSPDLADNIARAVLPLSRRVPANQWVRWRASLKDGEGNPADSGSAPLNVCVTLQVRKDQGVIVKPFLTVDYVNGRERTLVFTYSPSSGIFTPTEHAGGRASVAQAGVLEFFVESVLGLRVSGGVLRVNTMVAAGMTGPNGEETEPWLEFLVDRERVASLTKSGVFYVSQAVEGSPVVYTSDQPEFWERYEFRDGGLTGTLNRNGLVVEEVVQPI